MSEVPVLPVECQRVAIDRSSIERRVAELGADVAARHDGRRLTLVTVLRGGVFFLADLARAIDADVRLDFLAVAPYVHGKPGAIRVTKDLSDDIDGEHVVLVEDVLDTGLTANYVRNLLLSRNPSTVEVCALVDKPARRIAQIPVDYVGFPMTDRFLVGYGLDLNGHYRNLPYIAELREEVVLA